MTQAVTDAGVLDALRKVNDPDLRKDIVTLGFVKNLSVKDGEVRFTIELTTPACPVRDKMKEEARQIVSSLAGVHAVEIEMTSQVRSSFAPERGRFIPGVKNVLPIASGKGGVGKSTVSVNIALALSRLGARVGLMDADVYGPCIPALLGIKEGPSQKNNRILPVEKHGLRIMSTAFFMGENEAAIIRGPILHKMMEQFLSTVEWGDLDYLIIDLPPGTGDVQLSLCQMIPMTGAAVISTPQDIALRVAKKAILMFNKLNCPVLGIIENMSYFECSRCGGREEIFGSGGARKVAQALGLVFLGEIPLSKNVALKSDAGDPVVLSEPHSDLSRCFIQIAENLAAQISIRNMSPEIRRAQRE